MQYESDVSKLEGIFKARHAILIETLKLSKTKKGMREQLDQFKSDQIVNVENLNVDNDDEDDTVGALFSNRVPKKLQASLMNVGMNKKDTVNSFDEIGWFDPDIEP
jgi:hypothetical protein